jgi:hypothetical protein
MIMGLRSTAACSFEKLPRAQQFGMPASQWAVGHARVRKPGIEVPSAAFSTGANPSLERRHDDKVGNTPPFRGCSGQLLQCRVRLQVPFSQCPDVFMGI